MESPVLAPPSATAQRYVGEWNRLISSTNWEKGRIIAQWRADLVTAGASARDYSDEIWSREVGQVSSQHVGRLRRTYERFGQVYRRYKGLYWSHFSAATEWDDAEKWLGDASEQGWSVSQLRLNRWQELGQPADAIPNEEDVLPAEYDEDAPEDAPAADPSSWTDDAFGGDSGGGGEGSPYDDGTTAEELAEQDDALRAQQVAHVRPFAELPPLPPDLGDACEAFKLAIVRQRMGGWDEVDRDSVLATLDALRQLTMAPTDAESHAPF